MGDGSTLEDRWIVNLLRPSLLSYPILPVMPMLPRFAVVRQYLSRHPLLAHIAQARIGGTKKGALFWQCLIARSSLPQ